MQEWLRARLRAALVATPAALVVLTPCLAAAQAAPKEPYVVEVWAEVLFDAEGKATRVEVPDAAGQPEAFIERLKRQLGGAKVPPPRDAAGAPATLLSGVQVNVQITPLPTGGANARIAGINVGPRTVKAYAASQPDGVAAGGVYEARVRCTVTTAGRCRDTVVESSTRVDDTMRRWAMASLNGYEFAPQQINGQPIEGEVTRMLRLEMLDDQPKDFRDGRRIKSER